MSHKEYSVKMKNISDNLKLLGCIFFVASETWVTAVISWSHRIVTKKKRSDLEKVALKKSACKKIIFNHQGHRAHIGPSLRFKPYQKDEGKKARSLNWRCEEKRPHCCCGHLNFRKSTKKKTTPTNPATTCGMWQQQNWSNFVETKVTPQTKD